MMPPTMLAAKPEGVTPWTSKRSYPGGGFGGGGGSAGGGLGADM